MKKHLKKLLLTVGLVLALGFVMDQVTQADDLLIVYHAPIMTYNLGR